MQWWPANKQLTTVEINRYIKDLLLEHDCVVIPGLGGFIGTPIRAEVQAVTKTIVPPGKKVTFNGQLQRNDGLLIHHISLTQGISYDEAEQLVHQFVKESKKRLEQNGLIMFAEVGKLMTDAEGTVSFHATPGRNLLQESFGLKPVHYRQIFDTLSETEQTAIAPLQTVRTGSSKTKRFVNTYGMSIAAMLVLGIFIAKDIYIEPLALENFGFFSPKAFLSNEELPNTFHSETVSEPVSAGSLAVTGSLETAPIEATAPVMEDATPTTPLTPVETPPATAPVVTKNTTTAATPAAKPHVTEITVADFDSGFYVVLGSYASKRNAEKYLKQQQTKGLIIIANNNLYRVALPVGNTAENAYQQLEKQRQQENPAAWLVYNNQ